MIICDNCGSEDSTRYRLEIGGQTAGGRDFADLDFCAACAKSCFSGVFMLIDDFRRRQGIGVKPPEKRKGKK
jgi:hypothetical protein